MENTRVKKKILVVDDDEVYLEQLTIILTSAGYEVTIAQGKEAAEEALLTMKPDLAILDLMMEEKDSGFVLGYQIKKLYPDTPVILLTAVAGATGLSFSTQNPQEQSWTMVDKLMDKPVRSEQLKAEVRRMLNETPDVHGSE
jgi:two-component system, OmpR family, response regulator